MRLFQFMACAAALVFIVATPFRATAQSYSSRPIRIVTSEVGGGNDILARIFTPHLATQLGQNVLVENRPAGVIPGQVVSRAQPDGHTLLLYTSVLWTAPFFQEVPYDPVRDFVPVSLVASTPSVLVIHPAVQANSVKEFVALAKAKPGALNYAYTSIGAPNHLAGELFKYIARVDLVPVPYRGTAPALNDLISGRIESMFAVASASMPHVKAGRLKALGVSSALPSVLAPGIPTIASGGLAGYDSAALYGVFAPAKTPPSVVQRLSQEIVVVLARPEVKERMLATGIEPIGTTAEAFAVKMKADRNRVDQLVRNAGLRKP